MLTLPLEGAESLSEYVGKRIRQIRNFKGITLKEVADKANTTPQTIQRLETGNMTISVDWIDVIAKALSVPPTSFFPGGSIDVSYMYNDLLAAAAILAKPFGTNRERTMEAIDKILKLVDSGANNGTHGDDHNVLHRG